MKPTLSRDALEVKARARGRLSERGLERPLCRGRMESEKTLSLMGCGPGVLAFDNLGLAGGQGPFL